MSIRIMTQVWELDLPRNEKLVLLALADHANDEGQCFPSVARIAWKCGYSERSIQRVLRGLEARHVLSVLENPKGGRGRLPLYEVTPEKGAKLSPFAPERVPNDAGKGDTPDVKGDTGDQKGDTAMAPESSVESPEEPSKNRASLSRKNPKPETQVRCHVCDTGMVDEGDVIVCPDTKCGTYYKRKAS